MQKLTKMEKCHAIVLARFGQLTNSYVSYYFNEISEEKLNQHYIKYCSKNI
jgi:hypothetical protein